MTAYTVTWTVGSTTINLSGASYYTMLEGDSGWFMPNTNLILNYYQRHATVSRVRFEPRIIEIPLWIETSTEAEMDLAIDQLCAAFNPLSEVEGTLKVVRHDGLIREIKALYWNGLEGVRGKDAYNGTWYKTKLSLKCPNHAWYDPTPVTETYGLGTPGLFFPIFPLTLAAGALFGDETIANPGTMESWPIWEIDGPGSDPEIHNVTTGEVTKMSLDLLEGETLVVNTTPGEKTVKLGGVNKFNTLSIDSSLWSLTPGNQTVKVVLSGATAASEVRLSFYPRYISL